MSTALHLAPARARAKYQDNPATRESTGVRLLLLALGLGFFGIFLLLPLVAVFTEALRKGWELYFASLADEETFSAIKLTLTAAFIAVPLNLVFGVSAAWLFGKHECRG